MYSILQSKIFGYNFGCMTQDSISHIVSGEMFSLGVWIVFNITGILL